MSLEITFQQVYVYAFPCTVHPTVVFDKIFHLIVTSAQNFDVLIKIAVSTIKQIQTLCMCPANLCIWFNENALWLKNFSNDEKTFAK